MRHVEDSVSPQSVLKDLTHASIQITGVKRSRIHKDPPWEKDLVILMKDHTVTKILTPVPGHGFATTSDKGKDYFKLGLVQLQNGKALENYAAQRLPYFKSRVTTNDLSRYLRPPPPTADHPPTPPEPSPTPSNPP